MPAKRKYKCLDCFELYVEFSNVMKECYNCGSLNHEEWGDYPCSYTGKYRPIATSHGDHISAKRVDETKDRIAKRFGLTNIPSDGRPAKQYTSPKGEFGTHTVMGAEVPVHREASCSRAPITAGLSVTPGARISKGKTASGRQLGA